MKNFISLTVFCLLFTFSNIFSGFVYAANLETEEMNVIEDIIGAKGLNLILPNSDNRITRKEMVRVIANFIPLENNEILNEIIFTNNANIYEEYESFTDWVLEPEEELTIKKLYSAGIIRGYEDNLFMPDEYCTYAESITFIIRALGWKVYAENISNGFPNGYIDVAKQLEIIEDPLELDSIDICEEIERILFKSLFAVTLNKDGRSFYEIDKYLPSSSALHRYLGLEYKIGYASKTPEGIEIEKKDYKGNVINKPEFEEGNVLCIYEENEETNIREIRACVEISEEGSAYFSNLIKTLEEVHIE